MNAVWTLPITYRMRSNIRDPAAEDTTSGKCFIEYFTSACPPRQVRGHVHKMLGSWLAEFTDLRQALVQGPWPDSSGLRALAVEVTPALPTFLSLSDDTQLCTCRVRSCPFPCHVRSELNL